MKYDITVIIHRLYFNDEVKKGGLDMILDYFLSIGKSILLLEYPLDYKQSCEIRMTALKGSSREIIYRAKMPTRISSINWFLEFFDSIYLLCRYSQKGSVIVTSDPLNTIIGVLFRKIGFYRYHYYHSIDYSTNRFNNKLLNGIYGFLLKLGLNNADLVGVVTIKALEQLKSFGVKKSIYIPNSPDYNYLGKFRKSIINRKKYSIGLTCAEVGPKFRILETVKIVERLKSTYPEIHLNVIGNVNADDKYIIEIKAYIDTHLLKNNITFHGAVSRDVNDEILSVNWMGIALYDDDTFTHIKYGDSLKIRTYVALGLPVVADDATPTAIELNETNAGYMVVNDDETYNKINEIFSDSNLYETLSNNALKWAQKMDKRKLMNELTNLLG